MDCIETSRLSVTPLTQTELSSLIDRYRTTAPELSCAYAEMLAGCKAHPQQQVWYAPWKICLREDGREIGYAGFRGIAPDGSAEIGYGIEAGFEGQGFATQAVAALCRWALAQPEIHRLEAEAAPDNAASIAVLEKVGFAPTGVQGDEGPRFACRAVRGGQHD